MKLGFQIVYKCHLVLVVLRAESAFRYHFFASVHFNGGRPDCPV